MPMRKYYYGSDEENVCVELHCKGFRKEHHYGDRCCSYVLVLHEGEVQLITKEEYKP